MKKIYFFIAFATVASLIMTSCDNNKNALSLELSQEDVQDMKQTLTDSVMAQIDALEAQYVESASNSFQFRNLELTYTEKLMKPDYLLDPAAANTLVTKSQKISALAYYIVDYGVRVLYDMPLEDSRKAIVKLAAEVNHPISISKNDTTIPVSEYIKLEYEKCKENGDLAYFWQFEAAIGIENNYIIAQDPDLFFSLITEEQWKAYADKRIVLQRAICTMAEYDEEMDALNSFRRQYSIYSSDAEMERVISSRVSAKMFYRDNKDKYIEHRNSLIQ